jgi:hypothetical protein
VRQDVRRCRVVACRKTLPGGGLSKVYSQRGSLTVSCAWADHIGGRAPFSYLRFFDANRPAKPSFGETATSVNCLGKGKGAGIPDPYCLTFVSPRDCSFDTDSNNVYRRHGSNPGCRMTG